MRFLAAVTVATTITGSAAIASTDGGYHSPYQLQYTIPRDKLLAPDAVAPRNSVENESTTPFSAWYGQGTKKRYNSWGPEPTRYEAPSEFFEKADLDWQRQRLAAVGEKLVGLPYQHHHIPDWDPPADWPWKEVAYGRQSRGLDCSNFTSWLYNYGLGIRLSSNVEKQANNLSFDDPSGSDKLPINLIDCEGVSDIAYDRLKTKLKTGDLLYIKNRAGVISHVIMWLGPVGKSPDDTPLIMDCTGTGQKDSNGTVIPVGVQIRPFKKDSWYFKSLSHVHRILAP